MSRLIENYREADKIRKEEEEGAMNRTFGFGLTLLVLISVALLCSTVGLYIIKENEIEKRIALETELSKTAEEMKVVKVEMADLKEIKTKIEFELALKSRELQDYRDRLSLVKLESGTLEGEKSDLADRYLLIQQNFAKLQNDFYQLQESKEVLEQRLKNAIDSRVRLKTIIVEPEQHAETAPIEETIEKTIEGEVLAVNKEYEFLVINLGLNSGLNRDSDVSIYRSSELVAMAKIEKLYDNISAVVVNDKRQMENVKVGDSVVASIGEYIEDEGL